MDGTTTKHNNKHNDSMDGDDDEVVCRLKEKKKMQHPLEINDPVLVENVSFVTLEFLEKARYPVPKNQRLDRDEAFGELTERSVLVALSHGWFYQMHPDPQGVKIDIIVKQFGPRLRERYPETQILFFFDFLSVPQWPRTDEEDKVFRAAMKHMNSVYVYCDLVLFIETKLPIVDMVLRTAKVRVSDYEWTQFLDTVQVASIDNPPSGPQQYDCIVKCGDKVIETVDELKTFNSTTHVLSYLKRPFGRPNTIINDDRGWLFLERITIAIKAATAGAHRFDDIVVSNDEKLRTLVYTWMRMLLSAAKEKSELRRTLEHFDGILKTKRFSFQSDEDTVRALMTELVENFAENWEKEAVKQESSSKRLREILLRWGEFSNDYLKNARLLKQEDEEKGWMWRSFVKLVGLSVLGPLIVIVPFVLKVTDDCVDSLVGHAVWNGRKNIFFLSLSILFFLPSSITHLLNLEITHIVVHSILPVVTSPVLNAVYLNVPLGWHTLRFYVYCVALNGGLVFMFRLLAGDQIPPFMMVYLFAASFLFSTYFYKIPFFKHRDERDGRVERYGIEPWMKFPNSLRFDTKLKNDAKRISDLTDIMFMFAILYPILGGVFFQANVVFQACLVPVFFALRTWYEYKCDAVITSTFGSNKLPLLSFAGVMLHEICLSTMITSIKHPLVFVTLVFADVFENMFCFWSLSRSKSSTNVVVPVDSITHGNHTLHKKSLTKRSSSVLSLAKDLREVKDGESSQGTALFIAAILLQREMVETIVPIQAAVVMTLLYASDVKSNSMVSAWTSRDDYIQAMMYLGIDLGVEIIVFVCTIFALKQIYPNFSSFRILMGLVRSNSTMMLSFTIMTWLTILWFQNTLSGLDLTLKFEWLNCDGENATWVGGFNWDNC